MYWREGLSTEAGKRIERIAIREPVWDGRQVGIALYKAERSDVCEVRVNYRLVSGKPLLQRVLSVPSRQVLACKRVSAKGRPSTILCMVPLGDMTEVRR